MSQEKKIHVADENMQKFFKNLLELKDFVKKECEKKNDSVLNEIYSKLERIIKKGN